MNTMHVPLSGVNGSESVTRLSAPRSGDHVPYRARSEAPSPKTHGGVTSRGSSPLHDEADLVRRLSEDDPDALTVIADWLWQPLASYAYRLVDDEDVAMDVAQETCLRLWQGRGRTLPNALRPYLFRIARNLCLDYLKTRRARVRLLSRQQHRHVRRVIAPDEALARERVSSTVQRAIQELPERRREVFTLAYLHGLKYSEVSTIMNISPKTVQNQMTAALAQLRKKLSPLIDEQNDDTAGD